MKIDLTELLRKVGEEAELEQELALSFPEDGLPLTRPVKARLHLVNTGSAVLMDGTLETEAEVDCARCGQKLRQPLTVRITEEYSKNTPGPAARKGKEIELKENDFVYPIGPDNTLDLGETIRQNLILALPLKIVCQECNPSTSSG